MTHRAYMSGRSADGPESVDPIERVIEVAEMLDMLVTLHANGLALGGFAISRTHRARRRALPALATPATDDTRALDDDSAHHLLFTCELEIPHNPIDEPINRALRAALAEARHRRRLVDMRWTLLESLHGHLARAARHNRRQIQQAQWPDLRLDTWAETRQDAELRRIITEGLEVRSASASASRGQLGALVRTRQRLRVALDRVDALRLRARAST